MNAHGKPTVVFKNAKYRIVRRASDGPSHLHAHVFLLETTGAKDFLDEPIWSPMSQSGVIQDLVDIAGRLAAKNTELKEPITCSSCGSQLTPKEKSWP